MWILEVTKTQMKTTILCLLLAVTLSAQKQRGPSTPKERDTAVKAARLLETDPQNKDAKKLRQWFTVWLIEVPDITVQACTEYLGPSSKKPFANEIWAQTMFSSAAFVIEHPDQANDHLSVNVAGVEGSLKAYEVVLKIDPKAQNEFIDGLLTKRDKGELRDYVKQIMETKCKSK